MTMGEKKRSRKDTEMGCSGGVMNMIDCMQFVQNNVLKMHQVCARLCSERLAVYMKIFCTEL